MSKTILGITTTIFVMLALSACALQRPAGTTPAPAVADISYVVRPGNRLSGIARALTGRADNWRIIAERNGITNPRRLQAGQTIIIPGELLVQRPSTESPTDNRSIAETTRPASTTSAPLPVTTGNGVRVSGSRATASAAPPIINVFPVDVNRSFQLQPLENPGFTMSGAPRREPQTLSVRVAGSYYPRGLYAEPANYARLLRRVSPGTVFQLEGRVNDWYKVTTEEGVGYLRKDDASIIR